MNCCFVSFFFGRGKGMSFLPVCIGSVPRVFCGIVFQGIRQIDDILRFLLSGSHHSAFSDLLILHKDMPVSANGIGYCCRPPHAGTVSRFRSPEYGHVQGFVVTGINVSGWNTRIPSERKNSPKFCRVRHFTVTTGTTMPFSTTTIRILHQNRRDREGHLRHPVPVCKD